MEKIKVSEDLMIFDTSHSGVIRLKSEADREDIQVHIDEIKPLILGLMKAYNLKTGKTIQLQKASN